MRAPWINWRARISLDRELRKQTHAPEMIGNNETLFVDKQAVSRDRSRNISGNIQSRRSPPLIRSLEAILSLRRLQATSVKFRKVHVPTSRNSRRAATTECGESATRSDRRVSRPIDYRARALNFYSSLASKKADTDRTCRDQYADFKANRLKCSTSIDTLYGRLIRYS